MNEHNVVVEDHNIVNVGVDGVYFVDGKLVSQQVKFHQEIGFLQSVYAFDRLVDDLQLGKISLRGIERVLLVTAAIHNVDSPPRVEYIYLPFAVDIDIHQVLHIFPQINILDHPTLPSAETLLRK